MLLFNMVVAFVGPLKLEAGVASFFRTGRMDPGRSDGPGHVLSAGMLRACQAEGTAHPTLWKSHDHRSSRVPGFKTEINLPGWYVCRTKPPVRLTHMHCYKKRYGNWRTR